MNEVLDNALFESDVDFFTTHFQHYFPAESWKHIRHTLASSDKATITELLSMDNYKNPNVMFWSAFPGGLLGVDRFMLGDTGLGIVKLLTLGQFFIGFAVDCFTIFNRTRTYNYNVFLGIKTGVPFN